MTKVRILIWNAKMSNPQEKTACLLNLHQLQESAIVKGKNAKLGKELIRVIVILTTL